MPYLGKTSPSRPIEGIQCQSSNYFYTSSFYLQTLSPSLNLNYFSSLISVMLDGVLAGLPMLEQPKVQLPNGIPLGLVLICLGSRGRIHRLDPHRTQPHLSPLPNPLVCAPNFTLVSSMLPPQVSLLPGQLHCRAVSLQSQ
jgi:hypothetical protein